MLSYTQGQVFMIFFMVGVCVGAIYDIFRVIRKNFFTNDLITQFEDIIFLVLCGFIILYIIIKLNNGEIRFFIFIAIFLGILLYFLTFSKPYVIILNVIVKFCKNILIFALKPIKLLINLAKKKLKNK